jgi:hypothetical protein
MNSTSVAKRTAREDRRSKEAAILKKIDREETLTLLGPPKEAPTSPILH